MRLRPLETAPLLVGVAVAVVCAVAALVTRSWFYVGCAVVVTGLVAAHAVMRVEVGETDLRVRSSFGRWRRLDLSRLASARRHDRRVFRNWPGGGMFLRDADGYRLSMHYATWGDAKVNAVWSAVEANGGRTDS